MLGTILLSFSIIGYGVAYAFEKRYNMRNFDGESYDNVSELLDRYIKNVKDYNEAKVIICSRLKNNNSNCCTSVIKLKDYEELLKECLKSGDYRKLLNNSRIDYSCFENGLTTFQCYPNMNVLTLEFFN